MRQLSSCLALLFALVGLQSCKTAPPLDAAAMVREWAAFMDRDYVLRAGDKLSLSVYGSDELQQEVVVTPNGTVNFLRIEKPLIAKGKSMGSFRREVQAAYAKIVQATEVSLTLVEAVQQVVYVTGEVGRPGAVPYLPGMTLQQVIASAGGYDIRAQWRDVRVLRYRSASANADVATFRVNARGVLHDGHPDFLVLPGDVVYAQASTIADLNDIVTLYIRRLLPFAITGVSVGNQ